MSTSSTGYQRPHPKIIAWSLFDLGRVAESLGDDAAARALYEESLAIWRVAGDNLGIASCLEGLPDVVAVQGDPAWAARLWGMAEALREAMGYPLPPVFCANYEHAVATARTLIGEKAFAAAWACWILKYYGHRDVRLLDSGRVKWLADKREITTAVPSYPRTSYHAQAPHSDIRAFRDQILLSLGRNGGALVDVRSPAEYSGELLAPANLPQEGAQRGGQRNDCVRLSMLPCRRSCSLRMSNLESRYSPNWVKKHSAPFGTRGER